MPELPEVETTLRAIRPVLTGRHIRHLVVRHRQLRWPIPSALPALLADQPVLAVRRRAKYLLIETAAGTLIVHLGMSGSIRLHNDGRFAPVGPHDHVDIVMVDGTLLRYTDPRRFGAFLWTAGDPAQHPLLRRLGPEPWDPSVSAHYLRERAAGRRTAIKSLLMDNQVVVGVGNIYANEALFRAGIHPARAAGRISLARWQLLLDAIRDVLAEAIAAGGTTLKDFSAGEGRPGYFAVALAVYGRGGEACRRCGAALRASRIAGRSTVHCPQCQR